MVDGKFEPQGEISDVEIRLECIRLATEFGTEYEKKDPLPIAEKYFNWVKQISKKTTRKEPFKKKV
jgi:hypothetical protein|tara:strand:+ start:49 stop:246 length:198 start_codon:yes stop_codon:yes gene_type:complete